MQEALYTKWRPLSFDDVIAQPHITETLKKQVITGRTAHAYLFTGSRGTGKTTCARILAKAVNCPDAVDGNPCRTCEICVAADKFALSDIFEIDAASNNGVDDIRDLRDGAVFTPERCRYKIYIIDEVHMLSPSAFNALLKILEEPPDYVKFILATTEVHKIPATILSRCQRFDFRRIKPADIADRLLYVASQEKLRLTDEGAMLIARLADGGMRDALSLLDRCAAFSEEIDENAVASCAGVAGQEYIYDILDGIIDKKPATILTRISELHFLSKDMQRLCTELVLKLRAIMLFKASGGDDTLLDCGQSELERLKDLSARLSLDRVLFCIDSLQACTERLQRSPDKRLELEIALLRIVSEKTAVASAPDPQLEERIAKLEANATEAPQRREPPKPAVQLPKEQQVDFSKLRPEDFKRLSNWSEVLEKLYEVLPSVSGALAESCAYENGNVLLIRAKNPFFLSLFRQKENALTLGEVITSVTGKTYVIRAKSEKTSEVEDKRALKLIEKANQAGVETEIITSKPDGNI